MTKRQKKQPVKTTNKKKVSRQPQKQQAKTAYKVSITKRKDFELDDAIKWMDQNCSDSKRWHKINKKNIEFSFHILDDAFKFKLHYERA